MSSHPMPHGAVSAETTTDFAVHPAALALLVPVGRLLFAAIFLMSSAFHFTASAVGYAGSQGVPYPEVLVPLSGVLALAGGLSVLFGFKTRFGAAMIALFLVPVTVMMHAFWNVGDPQMHRIQMVMFEKNVSMLGGALLLLYFGGGPYSLDNNRLHHQNQRLASSTDAT